tara:strand:- start:6518 stop:6724 length:207 start_codon:yes stop_codon:yes gene_type:complete
MKYAVNWTYANRRDYGGTVAIDARQFHAAIGERGRAFMAELAETFGDLDPSGRRRLYFENAVSEGEHE